LARSKRDLRTVSRAMLRHVDILMLRRVSPKQNEQRVPLSVASFAFDGRPLTALTDETAPKVARVPRTQARPTSQKQKLSNRVARAVKVRVSTGSTARSRMHPGR
jgi:acyl-CoA thioesterase